MRDYSLTLNRPPIRLDLTLAQIHYFNVNYGEN